MDKKIVIKLVKSTIGRKPKHVLIAKLLGLTKMNSTVIHNDTPAIRGMVNTIDYLLHVEEAV
jgi:large subunit ribosomal protein L30